MGPGTRRLEPRGVATAPVLSLAHAPWEATPSSGPAPPARVYTPLRTLKQYNDCKKVSAASKQDAQL